jgi:hypothetical protein
MKMNKKKVLCFLAMLCLLTQLAAGTVLAAGRTASLTLTTAVGGTAVSGVSCTLYRAADINGTVFTATKEFAPAKIDLSALKTSGDWQKAAYSLASYAGAKSSGVSAAASGKSDASGKLSFSGLETGLYLAVFSPVTAGYTTYTFEPTLISLPQWGDGSVNYNVAASPKGSASTYVPGGSTVSVTVLKVWNDLGSESERPASITVELYKDGVSAGSAALTAQNNWRYTWTGLPDGHVWTVLESSVPKDYTVAYSADGNVLTVTNTKTTNIPESPTPGGNVPSPKPSPGTEIPDTNVPKSGKLPQTGQLWWPVPILAACGAGLFGVGFCRKDGHGGKK